MPIDWKNAREKWLADNSHSAAIATFSAISSIARPLPESERNSPEVRKLIGYGWQTRMHVVRLLALQLDRETHTRDIDFSPRGIVLRWDAGYSRTRAVLAHAPWVGDFDPLSGVVLHEQMELMPVVAE